MIIYKITRPDEEIVDAVKTQVKLTKKRSNTHYKSQHMVCDS